VKLKPCISSPSISNVFVVQVYVEKVSFILKRKIAI